jgi:hypothetical protein
LSLALIFEKIIIDVLLSFKPIDRPTQITKLRPSYNIRYPINMFTVQELDANMRPIIELLISTAVTSAVIKEMHASFLSKNVNFYLEKMPILEENLSRQSMSIEDLFGDIFVKIKGMISLIPT